MGLSRPTVMRASSLCTRWSGDHSSEAKTKAFAAGTNARLGTEDSEYDLEDAASRCDALERADPGPASGCVSHVGARGMAASRSAAHRVENFELSNDPQFEEKVRDVVGLYLNPPDRALVLCVDEKSQIQALDRTAPILPFGPVCRSGKPTITSVTEQPPYSRLSTS